jgi:hypothetical protein
MTQKNLPGSIDFRDDFGVISGSVSRSFSGSILDHFLDHFWATFGIHFGSQIGPRRAKTAPEEPSRAAEQRKAAIPKTLKNH